MGDVCLTKQDLTNYNSFESRAHKYRILHTYDNVHMNAILEMRSEFLISFLRLKSKMVFRVRAHTFSEMVFVCFVNALKKIKRQGWTMIAFADKRHACK